MVKNAGGNKTKRDARKHIAPQNETRELRVIKEEGETYAVVKKLLGCGQCQVTCLDGKTRLCIIRNKFKGRGRSTNAVDVSSWLLVGLRDWELKKNGKENNCDLLHVYSAGDKERLLQKNDVDFRALLGTMKELEEKEGNHSSEYSAFEFASTSEVSYQELLSNRNKEDVKEVVFEDTEFNIDDI
jgi:initiation factor 1A